MAYTYLGQDNPIDTHVKGVVDLLNSIPGVRTNASCSGHWDGTGSSPYISFDAPDGFAEALNERIRRDTRHILPWQRRLISRTWGVADRTPIYKEGEPGPQYSLSMKLGEFYDSGRSRQKKIVQNDWKALEEFIKEIKQSMNIGNEKMDKKVPSFMSDCESKLRGE